MTEPKIVMRGAVGIRLDVLKAEHIAHLQKRCTVKTIPYKDEPARHVPAYQMDDERIWLPRYFDHLEFWPQIKKWEWTAPELDYELHQLMRPLPERKQPEAIDNLEAVLVRDSGTIGVLPTGSGKTMIALSTARRFNTPIAVLIYSGHMIDNWVEHAGSVLGIPEKDVGLVKENRCDIGKPLTIVSIQTVLSRDLPDDLYNQFGFIIADEIHRYGAAKWSKVVSKFPARYRLGMSADPVRDDGLDPIVRWNFGKVGYSLYTRPTGELPTVCLIRIPRVTWEHKQKGKPTTIESGHAYPDRKYVDWKRVGAKWVPGSSNAMKYDKLLANDKDRNEWLVGKIIDARLKGRKILVFSRLLKHIDALCSSFEQRWAETLAVLSDDDQEKLRARVGKLVGGIKKAVRQKAQTADVIFTTFGFAREALNLPHLDTLIFATPPGNPLQPAGRLRDKGDKDRKALLIIDPFENGDYPFKKAMKRKRAYEDLGMTVKRLARKQR